MRVGESTTALWVEEAPGEKGLELGKTHNLRRAAMALDGTLIPAGAVFSFWRQLGRATRGRGFVEGRMLQEGCLMPAVGGGLCQLSNALYDVALDAGCRIVERHGHSRIVPNSAAAYGRDATVAWNYVDFRFAADRDLKLSAWLDRDSLIVELHARSADGPTTPHIPLTEVGETREARSCASCGETHCHMHARVNEAPVSTGRVAFLVDEDWPEFRSHVASAQAAGDLIGLPLDGARLGLKRYRWDTQGFADVVQAPMAALERSIAWRRIPPEGPARRAAEARTSARIAHALAAQLGPEVATLTVAQSLLPFLWREGWLGGRRFSVLMTRLPIAELHALLDAAFAAHPDRKSLADYRAPAWIAQAEAEALAAAEEIITPHAALAALFAPRSLKLDWAAPARLAPARRGDVIAFPGPVLARKGADAVRDAARRTGLAVRPLGRPLEDAAFWDGVTLDPVPASGDWLDGVAVVVQPALVQDAPRRLLEALAAGVPVIASPACGLDPQAGLSLVAPDDPDALTEALLPFATRAAL
ncbi:MAG TPA: VanW family protein [Caulobacteraceae bacterium]|nr:VanW family protein [Caulobacteraceae bacterium]